MLLQAGETMRTNQVDEAELGQRVTVAVVQFSMFSAKREQLENRRCEMPATSTGTDDKKHIHCG